MAQTSSKLFDNVGRMMNDAAGVADGVRREVETMVRAQAERFVMTELDSTATEMRPSEPKQAQNVDLDRQ